MPRKSAFETHAEGPALEQALLAGTLTLTEIAATLGITKSAVSQHKTKLLAEVQEAAAAKIREQRPQLIAQEAAGQVNELFLLEQNVLRLEELVAPLSASLAEIFKDLRPDTLGLLDTKTVGLVALARSLLAESGRLLDTLKRAKGELLPAEQVAEVARLREQIQTQNDFILQHPELLDTYETFLQQKEAK